VRTLPGTPLFKEADMKPIQKFAALFVVFFASLARAQAPSPTPVPVPAPSPAATPVLDGFNVSAQIGGSVSMAPNSATALTPIARLSVSGPLAIGSVNASRLPVMHVEGELSALPGDTIDQTAGLSSTLAQFKSLDFSLGLSHRVSQWLPVNGGQYIVATSVYLEAGFATRLDNEVKARDKAPRYGCAGLRFDEGTSGSFVKTGGCADERLDGTYQVTIAIKGNIAAFKFGPNAGASIFVSAILGINASSPTHPGLTGATRDSVNVGTLLGWN